MKKKRRKNSSPPPHSDRKDGRSATDKFLLNAKGRVPTTRDTCGPLSYGAGDWTYRVWRQSSKLSILFQYGRAASTVRVALDYDSLNGHIAFHSGKPQLLGGGMFAINGHPQTEGNRLLAVFLTFIDEGAEVDDVFIEIAQFVAANEFVGLAICDVDQEPVAAITYQTPEDRWEALESELEAR